MFKLEVIKEIYLLFKEDPIKTVIFFMILALGYYNWDNITYLKQIRKEDAEYYEAQINHLDDQLQRCHTNHIDDVKAFNYTLTKVSDHLDSIQRRVKR